jgi:hypothetical protein
MQVPKEELIAIERSEGLYIVNCLQSVIINTGTDTRKRGACDKRAEGQKKCSIDLIARLGVLPNGAVRI